MVKELCQNDILTKKVLNDTFIYIFNKFKIDEDFENNPYTRYLYYEEENKILGFINYNLIYDKIEIININVLEEYQNKKIGSLLLEFLIKTEKNISNITLEVSENNINAIKLYNKYGFKSVGIRKNYYNNNVNAILMERK